VHTAIASSLSLSQRLDISIFAIHTLAHKSVSKGPQVGPQTRVHMYSTASHVGQQIHKHGGSQVVPQARNDGFRSTGPKVGPHISTCPQVHKHWFTSGSTDSCPQVHKHESTSWSTATCPQIHKHGFISGSTGICSQGHRHGSTSESTNTSPHVHKHGSATSTEKSTHFFKHGSTGGSTDKCLQSISKASQVRL
jgi:hypothetical protein